MAGSENYKIMNLSIQDIQNDIAEYQSMIQKAQAELDSLTEGYLPYSEHKKRERIRRECEAEIKHVKQLIVYTREGIELRK